jgi:hypothetical protein
MDTKILLTGLVVGLLFGTGVGYGVTLNQQSNLQNQITIYKTESEKVPILEQQINTLINEKTNLQTQANALQAQITSLSSEKTNLEKQLNDLNNEITTKNNQINDLNQQLSQIKAKPQDYTLLAISFSRTQDTSSLISQWIGKANHTIRLLLYCITQDKLADSLISAKDRGIDVDIVIDDDNVNMSGSDYQELLNAGIDIRDDSYSGLMHHKVMIIDDSVVATGSYNWSAAAEDSNYENLILLRSSEIADLYHAEFERIWNQTKVTSNFQPTASFSYSPSGLAVTFTDTSQDDRGVVAWSWDFGDSYTSTIRSPSHTFTSSGTYHVVLTVWDASNLSSSTGRDVTVSSSQPVVNGPFWGSKNSDKYHYPTCYWATQIHPENLRIFSTNLEARNAGYVPCSVCNPP